ncbi:hypothetical protein KP509_02G079700 [Ceratopteris richardii]|nr:hypothetical protein KP509_02G079700 [Ceratopteris richardii]
MVNSSWTKSHIEKIWGIHDRIKLVYPPCDTRTLQELPLERNSTSIYFISVAQFRPEKAHGMQLEAFANLLNRLNKGNNSDPVRSGNIRLKLVGSCRNEEDKGRVVNLKQRCSELGIADKVDFLINVSYRELVELLGAATAGIHSMIDEHFGIVVVEYMAAGAIPIAHNSAGPKMDIVVEQSAGKVGFLATSVDEFASAMMEVINMSMEKRMEMASLARERAKLFSETQFDQDFKAAMSKILAEIRSSHKENVCT